MTKFFAQLKEFWFLIVFVMGIISAIWTLAFGAYVMTVIKSDDSRLYIQSLVDARLADANFPSDATIAEVNGALKVNEANISHNSANITLTREQLQDVADILMRSPD